MKVITLTQPWATLVAIGAKKIETRSWRTDYRGRLAIHAAKGLGSIGGLRGLRELINRRVFFEALMRIVPNYNRYCDIDSIIGYLPLGAIVAVCELRGCVATELIVDSGQAIDGDTYREEVAPGYTRTTFIPRPDRRWDLTDQEMAFGDYSNGRYAWLLWNARSLPEPVPAKGALGLWEWEGDL